MLCRSSASADRGAKVVVGEELDRAFGSAGRRRHEDDVIAASPRGADLLDPVGDAAVILERRPRRDVHASPGLPALLRAL